MRRGSSRSAAKHGGVQHGAAKHGGAKHGGVKHGGARQIRIIAGSHRGRRLSVPDAPGLRPTGDRIRETLFNWLQPVIDSARCLDAFAGSGVLGLEALSRGAAEVVALERSPVVAEALTRSAAQLGLEALQVVNSDALNWLRDTPVRPFDILFLDPPFDTAATLLPPLFTLLEQRGWVRNGGLIYLEQERRATAPPLSETWQPQRQQQSGEVAFGLWRFEVRDARC